MIRNGLVVEAEREKEKGGISPGYLGQLGGMVVSFMSWEILEEDYRSGGRK